MNIFVQGMRRSGTTILFDAFSADPRWDCWYEPLTLDRKNIGGGSGLQKTDYYAKVGDMRDRFIHRYPTLSHSSFNYGAPGRPELELSEFLPDWMSEYLAGMLNERENTVVKFTRMYCKTSALPALDNEALFIHVVRHPLAVAASYLFRRNCKRFARLQNPDRFFKEKSNRYFFQKLPWSLGELSDLLLNTDRYSHLGGCSDVVRVLMVWRFTFDETFRTARVLFGRRYRLLRYEDLASDPQTVMTSIYDSLNLELPESVIRFVDSYIKSPRPHYHPKDDRWLQAIQQVDMAEEMRSAGYSL